LCANDTVTCGQRLIEIIRLTVRHASDVELVEVSVGPAKDGLNHIVNQLLAAHEKTETLAVTGTGAADPPNLYADFLKTHGEGVQHLGVPVDDLEKSIAEYQKLGYTVAQSGSWGDTGKKGSGRYAYMHTDSIGGTIAELIRAVK
jgi:Glyoxalase/Bleomycin resistance protein/Dioxygenase superfamily